jgi:UDP-N-acetylmuramoyl-L-alanyl-D-glutamate--2,6-diaminopimelate ligase
VSQVQVIVDRRRAIEQAIRMMRKGDFLVIAGKGHETYQEVQGQRLPFDDVEEALQALTRISNTQ